MPLTEFDVQRELDLRRASFELLIKHLIGAMICTQSPRTPVHERAAMAVRTIVSRLGEEAYDLEQSGDLTAALREAAKGPRFPDGEAASSLYGSIIKGIVVMMMHAEGGTAPTHERAQAAFRRLAEYLGNAAEDFGVRGGLSAELWTIVIGFEEHLTDELRRKHEKQHNL